MSGSSFPKKNFLVYLPNNFHVWREILVQDYGAWATALHDEKLINFDYVVSNIPFDETLFDIEKESLRKSERKTGGEDVSSEAAALDGEALLSGSQLLFFIM